MITVATDRVRRAAIPKPEEAESRTRTKPSQESSLKKAFICSPFRPRGETGEERDRDWKKNIDMAQQACRFAVDKGYVPYAPHLFFPQFLSEDDPNEREMGILLGLTWLARCDELWIIGDRISAGMEKEIRQAKEWRIPIRHIVALSPWEKVVLRIFNGD